MPRSSAPLKWSQSFAPPDSEVLGRSRILKGSSLHPEGAHDRPDPTSQTCSICLKEVLKITDTELDLEIIYLESLIQISVLVNRRRQSSETMDTDPDLPKDEVCNQFGRHDRRSGS